MFAGTIGDVFRPCGKRVEEVYDFSLIFGGSLLLALCAQISVFLPFSAVPITGQTFAVLLIGAMLGSKRGSSCVLVYLVEGALGLPVFSGGRGGMAILFGPTGGYLIGFLAAAYVVGYLAERNWDRKIGSSILTMVLGSIVIYIFGATWLSVIIGVKAAIVTGILPFIVGDFIKILLAAGALPVGWKLLKRLGYSSRRKQE